MIAKLLPKHNNMQRSSAYWYTLDEGQNANVGMLPPSDSEDESEEEEVLEATKSKQVT